MNVEDDISRLRLDVAHLTRSNRCMEVAMTKQISLIREVLNALEGKQPESEHPPPVPVPVSAPASVPVMFFSDSMKRWSKDLSPPKRITTGYLMKAAIVQEWDCRMKPPKNTPAAYISHFSFNSI